MKKLLCFVLCIAMLVPVLSGCGSFFAEAEVMIKNIESELLDDGQTKIIINYTDSTLPPLEFLIPPGKEGIEGKEGVGVSEIVDKYIEPVKDKNGVVTKAGYTEITLTYTDERDALVFGIPDGVYAIGAETFTDPTTEQYCIQFTYSDGTKSQLFQIDAPKQGEKGDTGVGIDTSTSGLFVSDDGNTISLTLNFTDGVTQTVEFPKSVGIEKIEAVDVGHPMYDPFYYQLIITYTNGLESEPIRFPIPVQWRSGQNAPGPGIYGRDGDYFFAEDEKTIYRMVNGQWSPAVLLGDGALSRTVTFDLNDYEDADNNGVKDAPATLDSSNSTLTFKSGECFASNNYYNGDIPIPTRDGYKFDGWYAKRVIENPLTTSAFTDLTPISSNITLYAKWIKLGE